ncbi:MAG: CCA tRNA nucleotidyltransferase [Dehalococcoidales bacterium]|nr:CCA tRNA nucleotidyltransferase [Dehalococcoidales bacterium]
MPKIVNLASKIEKQLPIELVEFLESAGLIAAKQGWSLYLVGGVVRDLLLGRNNFDIDMVVEGDAVTLGKFLAGMTGGKITTHPRFGTAKLIWDKWTIDIVTARSETYARPGALPTAKPGILANDLFRRDFTINAMAVELISGRWGQLIDLYGGQQDLKQKQIRILHKGSFTDDATRIWRAIRYEQRLDFNIEANTMSLLKRDIPQLDTISGDRIRHELELGLKESAPEKGLSRADKLGALAKIHPDLKYNDWLTEKFQAARQLSEPQLPSVALYMALLTYSLNGSKIADLISYLHLTKPLGETLHASINLKTKLKLLSKPKLRPSRIYELLDGYPITAITANSLATDSPVVRHNIQLFLTKLRYVKPAITGEYLKKQGIPAGPRIKEILRRLLEARLDGKVTSRKSEEELVRSEIS